MDTGGKPLIAIFCWEAGQVPRGLVQLESLVGNSTNLDSYTFPVKLCRIEGANVETVLENPSPAVLSRMIEKARELSADGIKAITTSCGFNAIFQKELAGALDVPVFTSSLLQVPYLRNVLPENKSIAVITAKKASLKEEHLGAVGISRDMKVVVFGMENSPEWNKIFTDPDKDIDLDVVSSDVVATAANAVREYPDIGAFALECTDLPPFSQAIREATGRPVLDFITMMRSIAGSIGVVKIK
jgi:hypothetical protein